MRTPEPSPYLTGFDVTTAHAARVYDYLLGGKDNFKADREVAHKTVAAFPQAAELAGQQREFLRRITAHAVAKHGIRQFLELGSGLPTVENVHEIAQRDDSGARVVYVDHDPIVKTHGAALLVTNDLTRLVIADLRLAGDVLDEASQHLDLDQPIAISLVGVTHFLSEADDPCAIIAAYRERLVPGSSIGISAATSTGSDPEMLDGVRAAYAKSSSPVVFREEEEIVRFFDGLTVVEPGIVDVGTWSGAGFRAPSGVRVLGAVGLVP